MRMPEVATRCDPASRSTWCKVCWRPWNTIHIQLWTCNNTLTSITFIQGTQGEQEVAPGESQIFNDFSNNTLSSFTRLIIMQWDHKLVDGVGALIQNALNVLSIHKQNYHNKLLHATTHIKTNDNNDHAHCQPSTKTNVGKRQRG